MSDVAAEVDRAPARFLDGVPRPTLGLFARLGLAVAIIAAAGALLHLLAGYLRHRQRVNLVFYRAKRERKEMHAAAQKLARDLSAAVGHYNRAVDGADAERLRCASRGMEAVIARIPPGTDLTPLLRIGLEPPGAYAAASDVLRSYASKDWLLERSCASDERVRAFAVEVLRHKFLFNDIRADDAAKLAERTSLSRKKGLYDERFDAVHRRLERRRTGGYHLRLSGLWRRPGTRAQRLEWSSSTPPVRVTCKHRQWGVTFGKARWTGTAYEMPRLTLACRVLGLPGFPLRDAADYALNAARVVLTFDEQFKAEVKGLATYVPTRRGTAKWQHDPSIPSDARVVAKEKPYKLHGLRLTRTVYEWTLPGKAGFERLDASVVKAR